MSSSLLLALAAGLLTLAFLLALVVLAGVVVLFWMRSGTPAPPPPPRPDPAERERRKAAARGRASAPPARSPPQPAPRPSVPPPSTTAGPLQPGPMIGFFDDETSTGAAMQQVRQASLSSAFLSVPPTPSNLGAPPPPRGVLGADDTGDEAGEGDATEIFSANTVSAELAALLEEPDDPGPPSPFASKK